MVETSEKELIKRCQRGDQKAFAELVDRYKVWVFTIIDRMIYDESQTEDLAQEVFIRIFKGIADFRGKAKLSTWIYRITYNICLTEIARKGREKEWISLDEENPLGGQSLGEILPGGEDFIRDHDIKDTVEVLLKELSPRYRMVITLYYLREMSYQEIGEVMDLPRGTVKAQLHRAKKFMRRVLLSEDIR